MKYIVMAFAVLFSSLYGEVQVESKPAKVVSVNSANFKSEVEDYKGFVVLDVYAVWCGPCKKMKPIFEALSSQYPNIKFVQLDSGEASDIAKRFDVKSLPTFLYFKDGKLVGRQQGSMESLGIQGKIKEVFGQ